MRNGAFVGNLIGMTGGIRLRLETSDKHTVQGTRERWFTQPTP